MRVRPLVESIERAGYWVWWDRSIDPGASFGRYVAWPARVHCSTRRRPKRYSRPYWWETGSALGWGVSRTGSDDLVYTILGSLQLYSVLVVLEPSADRAIIAMTNAGESHAVKQALMQAVQTVRHQ